MTNKFLCPALFLTGCLILGCGGKGKDDSRSTVTGKVTLPDGSPVPGGTINFRSTTAAERLGNGEIQADGSYTAKDVPQGECKVWVDNSYLKQSKSAGGYAAPEGANKAGAAGTKYVPIKDKYTDENKTDLKVTVTGSSFTYNAELK